MQEKYDVPVNINDVKLISELENVAEQSILFIYFALHTEFTVQT